MYSIHKSDVKVKKLEGRNYKLLASEETIGCRNLCMLIAYFPPKKHAPGHIHDVAEEVIYCLEGRGEIVIGKRAIKIRPGTVIYIPPKSLHSVNNTSKNTMKLLCMFSPSIRVGAYNNYKSK